MPGEEILDKFNNKKLQNLIFKNNLLKTLNVIYKTKVIELSDNTKLLLIPWREFFIKTFWTQINEDNEEKWIATLKRE
jgi:hypothetical protein